MVFSLQSWRGSKTRCQRTSKFTTAPARTFCPAGGHCVTMMLEGCGVIEAGAGGGPFPAGGFATSAIGGGATLTGPNLNPAVCSVRAALSLDCPLTVGLAYA